jgi:hypothetical protein
LCGDRRRRHERVRFTRLQQVDERLSEREHDGALILEGDREPKDVAAEALRHRHVVDEQRDRSDRSGAERRAHLNSPG